MKKILLNLLIPVSLLLSTSLFAQVANDVCSGATLLTASADTTCTVTVATFGGAQEESAPSTCSGANDSPNAFDTWFKFVANDPKMVVDVTTLAQGGGFQGGVGAVVAVYDACGGTQIACGNPNIVTFGMFTIVQSGLTRATATGLTIGNEYFVRVYNYGDTLPAAGRDTFEICVHQAPAPPANDICTNSTLLTVGTSCTPIDGSLNGASQESAAAACGTDPASGSAVDIWYSFVANQTNEIIEVSPKGQAQVAPVIEVYSSCGGTQMACANPRIFPGFGAIPGTTTLNSSLYTPGNTYFVRVFHYGDNAPTDGNLTICIYDAPPAPANDICTNAVMLTVHDTCDPTAGTVASAVQEMAPVACGADAASETANDVWYSFTAVNASHLVDVTANGGPTTGVAAVIELYDACGGTMLGCANPTLFPGFGAIAGTTTLTATGLTPATTYFVRVYHYGNAPANDGTFDICVYNAPPPPVNDTCSGAIELTVTADCTPTPGSLDQATEESPAETCNGVASTSANDVWYKFTALNAGEVVEVNSQLDPVVVVYDACGGVVVDCANPDGSGLTAIELAGLTPGNTYFVRVYNNGDLTGPGDFSICVHDLPAVEPNDECANAILINEVNSKADCVPTQVSTVNATQSAEATTCGANATDDDVWYKFVATSTEATAAASNKSQPLANTNIGFALYKGSCSGQQATECSQGTAGDSLLFKNLVVGETYYLRTFTRGGNARGTYDLCVYKNVPPPAPVNDLCAGALVVTATNTATCTTPLATSVAGANQESPADNCGGTNSPSPSANDVWFKFTAVSPTADIDVTAPVVNQTAVAAVVALYDANGSTCGGLKSCAYPRLISVGGNTFAVPGTTKLKTTGLTIGTQYYVRVYHYGAANASTPAINVCIYDSLQSVGIDENIVAQSLNLYPNPTKDKVDVSFNVSSKASIKVMSLTGQVIYSESIDKLNGTCRRTIDLANFAKGIYTVQIVTDKESVTRKVIHE